MAVPFSSAAMRSWCNICCLRCRDNSTARTTAKIDSKKKNHNQAIASRHISRFSLLIKTGDLARMFRNIGAPACGLNKAMAEEFERIVREYQDKIFRLALSMLGDRAAAEETAQDVLVRVWKGLPGFRADSSLSTWIYSITRNTCLTALGRSRLRTASLDEPAPRREVENRAAAGWFAPEPPDAAALLERLPARFRQ